VVAARQAASGMLEQSVPANNALWHVDEHVEEVEFSFRNGYA